MNDIAIRIENLGKLYRIVSAKERNKTFREAMTDMVTAPWRYMENAFHKQPAIRKAEKSDYIWALKDVSCEIKRGEAVGIIGRNGAGKSTLLKILSRITEPTEGRIVMHGRVGSLLEVGTGFHSELTGEENIYLSGTILGMSSDEISKKFDEIVAFAEVGKFIRTPVKHYSSGMELRLAFAVAAHMEPEILMADEVLAVGDAAYQKKCLGKMGDVARAGRTVVFVSHNMQAVQALCEKTILLEGGRIVDFSDSRSVVNRYLADSSSSICDATWDEHSAPGNQEIRLIALRAFSENHESERIFHSCEEMIIEMRFIAHTVHPDLFVGFDLKMSQGEVLARVMQTDLPPEERPLIKIGENVWQCHIPKNFLNAGIYYVSPIIGIHGMYWILNLESVIQFEVFLDHGAIPRRPGMVAPLLKWESRTGS